MKNLFAVLCLALFINYKSHAQTTGVYDQVSMDDLLLKDCDFEKGASAMVLLDKGDAVTSLESVAINYFKRIKIFTEAGKDAANVRITYYSCDGLEQISNLEAETINLEDGKIVATKVEPSQIYTEQIDKNRRAVVFAFPQVKPGSVLEYKYRLVTSSADDFVGWAFQEDIPVRYSELAAKISYSTLYNIITTGYQPFVKDTSVVTGNFLGKGDRQCWWAKANLPSYAKEPFVTPGVKNKQGIYFQLKSLRSGMDFVRFNDTWERIVREMMTKVYFADQLHESLSDQDVLIKKAKSLATDDEKIAYLFAEVKKSVTWNKVNDWATDKGVKAAWSKKTGNSAEINIILYNLLKKSGVKVYPMLVSTRNNGVINPKYGQYDQANVTVDYIPTADTSKYYVLDAAGQYNLYNEVPAEFLNTYGIVINPEKRDGMARAKFLTNEIPAKEVVIIDAAITADHKVSGSTLIANYSYNKAFTQALQKKLGAEKYINHLIDNNNGLKITEPVFENMEVDSLPLTQNFNFVQELTAADDQYIYFNPNLFSPLHSNPFLGEKRNSDIDFGYCNAYIINGTYKIPPGYNIDALPKSMVLNMPDKSIVFKRVAGLLNGSLQVHYNITYTRSTFSVGQYPAIREFYKKMYSMLNEPIVFKKS
ncbi:DUF3857 domain-containing protein [Mucilaginibacter paludis]|uniref:DUF3857 domain-containing protein n=1 Tax=Mucilaginibacter paludis DSM 18603 TaxID=714943 RepID=H1YAP0_9SPHI|nr:DUF3857 domain-containing protein [Mucilaginibacter paludis]EHQ29160.1 hypothetical protein Mucpa_5083 [Mucilaginibacter paludis DSM 18603]